MNHRSTNYNSYLTFCHNKGVITVNRGISNSDPKRWLNPPALITMIPTTVLAVIAALWVVVWMTEGIAMQSDLALIGKDIQTIKERLDKLDKNFEYIRNNMVTRSDIQQLQSDVAQSRQTLVDHLTYQHGATKP